MAGADTWVVVLEGSALPVSGGGPISDPPPGRVLLSEAAIPQDPAVVHTLRELEGAAARGAGEVRLGVSDRAHPAALAFRPGDSPPADGETVDAYLLRLAKSGAGLFDPAFRVIRFEDPSERERPELTRRLPRGKVRILDVGCGAGGGVGSARERNPGWNLTGIERDPALVLRARGRCDRVIEGDLTQVLPRLAGEGERFDVLVFADVLEHVEDPISVLKRGRDLAAPGARLLASVPNVGHLSIVRDLVAGRFDPVPAGLCDVGHLRWFTRSGLREALEESGWRVESIEGEPGAPPAGPERFLDLASSWSGSDRESLFTYQWIAECTAD